MSDTLPSTAYLPTFCTTSMMRRLQSDCDPPGEKIRSIPKTEQIAEVYLSNNGAPAAPGNSRQLLSVWDCWASSRRGGLSDRRWLSIA
jgi:hypothetical protein